MAIQDQIFSLATKIIQVISLKNVFIWALAALVLVLGLTVFENRTEILRAITSDDVSAAPVKIGETSQLRAKRLVDTNDLMVGVTVLNADIRNNRRIPVFWYSDIEVVQTQLDAQFNDRYGGIPLFTSDEKNNESIVGVINGEFACGTFEETGSNAVFPGLGARFPFICRTSLPPYYGQFSGYIVFALNRTPTADDLAALKTEALNLSTEIYFRDVLPQSRKLENTGSTVR